MNTGTKDSSPLAGPLKADTVPFVFVRAPVYSRLIIPPGNDGPVPVKPDFGDDIRKTAKFGDIMEAAVVEIVPHPPLPVDGGAFRGCPGPC